MRGSRLFRRLLLAACAAGLALVPITVSAAPPPMVLTGTTIDSTGLPSQYKIEVPSNWNGTLVLYSHGYSFTPSPATDAGDLVTGAWLLGHGYALAGSSYSTSGWALQQAFEDQVAVLDAFAHRVGTPSRTIAWGHSLGGMITAGLIQNFPGRFSAALPMCGVVAGGVGVWNQALDSEFAFKTLAAPAAPFTLVNFNPATVPAQYGAAIAALDAAQATPQGRARIALAAAFADVPGWYDPASAEPAGNFAAQEANQYAWDRNPDFAFGFFGRAELEHRAGGNVSWNSGVDYRVQLSHSVDLAEVMALYSAAGLDLEADLDTLNAAPRISADPGAVAYLTRYITYTGDIDVPVLTMHTTGDGLVEVTDEQAYAAGVRRAGENSLLREVFVHRAGHCSFTPAETVSAFQTLVHRLDSGRWEASTSPAAMNAEAAALGLPAPSGAAFAPSFITFQPRQFLRPFPAPETRG